jgi:hypothetical protein
MGYSNEKKDLCLAGQDHREWNKIMIKREVCTLDQMRDLEKQNSKPFSCFAYMLLFFFLLLHWGILLNVIYGMLEAPPIDSCGCWGVSRRPMSTH